MVRNSNAIVRATVRLVVFPFVISTLILTGCGSGGSGDSASTPSTTSNNRYTTMVSVDASAQPEGIAAPTFHVAPVILDEPPEATADDSSTTPHQQNVPLEFADLSTRRLTLRAMNQARQGVAEAPAPDDLMPMATNSMVITYSPAQIRAAYGFPVIPAAGAALSAAQAAQLGAGQTIYIVDAFDDPNATAELATFNQKFGLPACTNTTIAANAALPLPAASGNTCAFSIVYAAASGTMTTVKPLFDSSWATEIALDVQWAHATAPLARIILIEAASPSLQNLTGAIALANRMGPGVVSMSWGASEAGYTASYESYFSTPNMTYLAAAGDSGAAVGWPAVSPHIVAVGGTSLTWYGSGSRSEVTWSRTGGGISQFTPAPSYQSRAVPGMLATQYRAVTDVSLNADPNTGQYIAVIAPGTTSASWLSAGGTSLSTPQWAGVLAVANAMRAQRLLPLVGAPHGLLYNQISTNPSAYASVFLDVTQGSDGSCATCNAKTAYDLPTGLGTPNVSALLGALTGSSSPVSSAPVVSSSNIAATAGVPLSFTVTVSSANPVAYSLVNAPSGMTISNGGVVSWPAPVTGTYAVKVAAQDSVNGLVGQGTYTVAAIAPRPPIVAGSAAAGRAGIPLSFVVTTTDTNPVTWTLSGAPSGMAVGAGGSVSWASPQQGTYRVVAIARDSVTGLSGQGTYTVTIGAPYPPSVLGMTITGSSLHPLSFTVTAGDPNPLAFSLTGAPRGMTIASPSGTVSWASPAVGTYNVVVTATDTRTGLSGQGTYTVKIVAAPGPVITATALKGVAGQPLTGTITFADSASNLMGVAMWGYPSGMSFTGSMSRVNISWPAPIVGNYVIYVQATDAYGLSAQLTVPVTITAH